MTRLAAASDEDRATPANEHWPPAVNLDVLVWKAKASLDPWIRAFTIVVPSYVASFSATTADIFLVQQIAVN